MKKMKGLALVEVLITVSIVLIVSVAVLGSVVNNRGWTEERALAGAAAFLTSNNIVAKRVTCAGDSDGDGYGTCNVVTAEGEKVILNCPTNFLDVKVWGASNCKEVFTNYNLTLGQNQ
jgi:type II secretory pathway pseudopilin PulG